MHAVSRWYLQRLPEYAGYSKCSRKTLLLTPSPLILVVVQGSFSHRPWCIMILLKRSKKAHVIWQMFAHVQGRCDASHEWGQHIDTIIINRFILKHNQTGPCIYSGYVSLIWLLRLGLPMIFTLQPLMHINVYHHVVQVLLIMEKSMRVQIWVQYATTKRSSWTVR